VVTGGTRLLDYKYSKLIYMVEKKKVFKCVINIADEINIRSRTL